MANNHNGNQFRDDEIIILEQLREGKMVENIFPKISGRLSSLTKRTISSQSPPTSLQIAARLSIADEQILSQRRWQYDCFYLINMQEMVVPGKHSSPYLHTTGCDPHVTDGDFGPFATQ
jgi:hypothetical protein